MKEINSLLLILIICLFSCTNNSLSLNEEESYQVIKNEEPYQIIKNEEPPEITWIDVPDSLTNFEMLLTTDDFYYIGEMLIDYKNYGNSWPKVDTIMNENGLLKMQRFNHCQISSIDSSKFWLTQEEHTFDTNLGRVIKFNGESSGYIASVECKYDNYGKLIEYIDGTKFCLTYDDKNCLKKVFEVGARKKENQLVIDTIGVIKFRKIENVKIITEPTLN